MHVGGTVRQQGARLHVVVITWTDWLPQSTSDPPRGGEVSPCKHRLVPAFVSPVSFPRMQSPLVPIPGHGLVDGQFGGKGMIS